MALKRLDEEFELKPGTQLLPYMKRLLPSLEGRFQSLENERKAYEDVVEDLRAVALNRINEILIPATQDIIEVTKFGFLLGPSSSSVKLELGQKTFVINAGAQRDTFTPSPFLIIEHASVIDDYAIARLVDYDNVTGALMLNITAHHGNPGPHTDWMISSTPGMADSTKIYHDAVGPMHDQVQTDTEEVRVARDEVIAASEALMESGLDVFAFIRRDGTVPFIATQTAVHPAVGSNDATIPTTAWSRARMQEYVGQAMQRTGDVMSGPLTLYGPPSQPLHASTKAYVDSLVLQGGERAGNLIIRTVNPTLRLYPTGAQQNRMLEAVSSGGVTRWILLAADAGLESGGNAGSNFALNRYNDGGAFIDQPLIIDRASGTMTTKAVNMGGSATVAGNFNVNGGDITTYRAGSPGTGIMWMNQAHSAYHHWDGGTHVFVGGALSSNGGNISGGHINCYSIYTNGHYATVWGMTSHGSTTINGNEVINGTLNVQTTGPTINMYDTDWGPMYLHHQQENIGFLNHAFQWVMYVNINGHQWSPAYGWLHDYVNSRASAYAWDAANYRYNQCVTTIRFAHLGDVQCYFNQLQEPWSGGVITGATGCWYSYYVNHRFRQCHMMIAGGWYAAGY